MARTEEAKRSTYVAPQRKRRGLIGLVIGLLAVVGIVIGAAVVLPPIFEDMRAPADYEGTGADLISVSIPEGATGTDVAGILFENDVIASQEAMVDILVADSSITFQPGTYELKTQMSAQAAIDALVAPGAAQLWRITIPEGWVITQVFDELSAATGFSVEEFESAAESVQAEHLPEWAISLEGWMFPATYEFDPTESSAESILVTLVNRMHQALEDRGVTGDEAQEVLTMAALVQREGRTAEDFDQMARVFFNRLEIDMKLQSDATVAYGTGHMHVVTTTPEERADTSNPYNTYAHHGLPVGPIGAPGDTALDAAINPADGDWLFFVTVNPETGETVFSETYEEHEQAVARFQEWLAENPSWGS
ncbi:endolytic transglycosylase MltG [Agrococcus casei]|uniref:endolytic transglycosylase MltG n=1 Tax=Agrococcus casei TaxID=343512 RepID=UPI003F903E79